MLDGIVASGAAIFKALEEDHIAKQGLSVAAHGAYYRLLKEEGSAQFRYWVSMNKHDYSKLLTFFNMQNGNMLVSEGSKIVLDRIITN